MKRILFTLAVLALAIAAATRAEARTDVSIDFFYNNLSGGNWIEVGDYGYVWQPGAAVDDSSWRPYSDGYWAYTDVGWTWVSYEDFGWATYHYGRWARLADYGWVWVPGTEWGPAWVSWRTGGDYVGWAPLPPRRSERGFEVVYEGRPVTSRVDLDLEIGPAYYNFCDVHYFGEPVLRSRIFAPEQNVTYINQTVNVTNITYNNNTVYNYGPDYNQISAYSTRPIQRLRLQRETNVDPATALHAGALTKVEGDRLVVAAPQKVAVPPQQVAPKVVKTKVEQPHLETGWAGITDPQTKDKLKEKIKTENPKAVPPPSAPPAASTSVAGNPPPEKEAGPGHHAGKAAAPAGMTNANPKKGGAAPAALPATNAGAAQAVDPNAQRVSPQTGANLPGPGDKSAGHKKENEKHAVGNHGPPPEKNSPPAFSGAAEKSKHGQAGGAQLDPVGKADEEAAAGRNAAMATGERDAMHDGMKRRQEIVERNKHQAPPPMPHESKSEPPAHQAPAPMPHAVKSEPPPHQAPAPMPHAVKSEPPPQVAPPRGLPPGAQQGGHGRDQPKGGGKEKKDKGEKEPGNPNQ